MNNNVSKKTLEGFCFLEKYLIVKIKQSNELIIAQIHLHDWYLVNFLKSHFILV